MRWLIAVFCFLLFASAVYAQDFIPRKFAIEQGSSLVQSGAQKAPQYPNYSGKDQIGDMIWNVRRGDSLLASYIFKDSQENPIFKLWLERITLYSRKKDGTWMKYAEGGWPACSEPIPSNFYGFHVTVNLTLPQFQEYQVGDRLDFYWYIKFCDLCWFGNCGNTVEKSQYFQVIKGEPLPLYPGQYSANTHGHSFYTDDLLEWGGSREQIKPSCVASDLDVYWWTDHGYDLDPAERDSMVVFARRISDASFLVIPGCEAQIDKNDQDNFPDEFLHGLTSPAFLTPWELELGDNTLWTLGQLIDSLEARQGYWLAAHPFDRPYFESDGSQQQWPAGKIDEALADPRFLGFEIWNGMRTSTQISFSSGLINPFPWAADYSDQTKLMAGLAKLDSIQAARLSPLRRILGLAGADNHGDYNYTVAKTLSGDRIWNNALGKCFTAVEMLSLTKANFWQSLIDGRCYLSNGPGCQFGVDQNGDSQIDVGLGGHFFITDAGKVIFNGKSNGEFGDFAEGIIYWVTANGQDSLVLTLNGRTVSTQMPVSFLPPEAGFIRGILKTSGGYGDYPGLVITNPVYFDLSSVTEAEKTTLPTLPKVAVYPNPSPGSFEVRWTGERAPEKIAIYDVSGKRVKEIAIRPGEKFSRQISLTSGVYFVQCVWPRFSSSAKVITVR
ncbi:MAG: T9SS type A sorting domain-containing protein [Patescibacteria group bacterium]